MHLHCGSSVDLFNGIVTTGTPVAPLGDPLQRAFQKAELRSLIVFARRSRLHVPLPSLVERAFADPRQRGHFRHHKTAFGDLHDFVALELVAGSGVADGAALPKSQGAGRPGIEGRLKCRS